MSTPLVQKRTYFSVEHITHAFNMLVKIFCTENNGNFCMYEIRKPICIHFEFFFLHGSDIKNGNKKLGEETFLYPFQTKFLFVFNC